LGFEWRPSKTPNKLSLDDHATYVRERVVEARDHRQLRSHKKISALQKTAVIKSTSLSKSAAMAKSTSTSPPVEIITLRSEEAREAQFDESDLEGSPSELASKPSLYSDRQAAKSLTSDKSAPDGDSADSNTRKDALQAKVPWPAHQMKSINSISRTLLHAGPTESGFLVAAKKPANSREGAESQLETAPSNEMLRTNPVVAEPLQQKLNVFTHALLLGDEPTGNGVQPTPDESANTPQDMQQTPPPDEFFQSDNVLNEVGRQTETACTYGRVAGLPTL
jgi:hypothetical protein